ncbi:MAG: DUF4159 domain-containing protein [Acidobacteria bacterium]|nr:DUF4159 domain-containing protein [Acidobacteriota bacterium]
MKRKLLAAITATGVLLIGIAVATESWAPTVAEEAPQRRRGGGGFGFGFGRRGTPYSTADLPINNMPQEGKFTFLRLRFDEAYTSRGGYEWGLDMGWNHDYPRAEHNLTLMLEELTNMPITIDFRGGNIHSFSDPEIFDYPFVYISEPGYWLWNDEEVLNLRNYLLKGGFIMVDDMQSDDTEAFHRIINEAIPNTQFEILDTSHPIFNCFFQITSEDILNQYYRSRYGNPVIYGVYEDNDPGKRLMAVVNHNQDIGESWEFSNTGYVPVEQANNSYKIGINYIICSMLH